MRRVHAGLSKLGARRGAMVPPLAEAARAAEDVATRPADRQHAVVAGHVPARDAERSSAAESGSDEINLSRIITLSACGVAALSCARRGEGGGDRRDAGAVVALLDLVAR